MVREQLAASLTNNTESQEFDSQMPPGGNGRRDLTPWRSLRFDPLP
jgi:hypothetical protein